MFARKFYGLVVGGILLTVFAGAEPAAENAGAREYRKNLDAADKNKDGVVTREELGVVIAAATQRDAGTVEKIVAAMMRDLDTDKDAKLSAAEIDAGARKVGENYFVKQNVRRAQAVMGALGKYKSTHAGAIPATLDELVKLGLAPEEAFRCIMADGNEKAWAYTRPDKDKATPGDIVLYSPGGVDSAGQYVVGLNDGSVAGVRDGEEAFGKIPGAKARIIK